MVSPAFRAACGASVMAAPRPTGALRTAISSVLALCLAAGAAHADGPAHQRFEFALDSTASYDTNPDYAVATPGGAASLYTGGSMFLNENDPRLKVLLAANGGYTQYEGAYNYGYLSGLLNGRLEYVILPEHLYWTASEMYGQDTANAYVGPSGRNLTNVNLFSTGPQFMTPLNDNFTVSAGGTVGEARYQGQPGEDSNRLNINLGIAHPIERFDSVSLQGTFQRLNYTNQSVNIYGDVADYSIENLFFRWFEGTTRNDMTIEVGEGRVSQGPLQYTSPTLRVNLNRLVSPHWNLGVVAYSEYSDTAQQVSNSLLTNRAPYNAPTPGMNPVAAVPLSAQPIKVEQVRFVAKYVGNRTEFVGGLYKSKEEYLDAPALDTTSSGISGRFTRRLTFKTDLALSAGIAKVAYAGGSLVETTEDIGPVLSWRASPSFMVISSLGYERRTSTDSTYTYSDGKISIGFRWSPYHHIGTFNQSPTSFDGVGGSGMQNMFSAPAARY